MDTRLLADGLYQYLLRLQEILQHRGATRLADTVQFASRFAFGSTTELYTEAENALRGVLADHGSVLREEELCELREILKGIDAEFKLIGGA